MLRGGFKARVIVLDLAMPGMTGEEFRIAQLGDVALRSIPVILYSSGDDLAIIARRMGVTAHVSKPAVAELLSRSPATADPAVTTARMRAIWCFRVPSCCD